jgi:hypothetical protein
VRLIAFVLQNFGVQVLLCVVITVNILDFMSFQVIHSIVFELLVFHKFLKPNKHFTLKTYVKENCAFLGHYTASSGNFLPTFRDNLSGPSLGVKNSIILFFYS